MGMPEAEAALEEALFRLSQLLDAVTELWVDLQRVVETATRVVPGCDDATISLIREGAPRTEAATGRFVLDLDVVQYQHDEGPCLEAADTGVVVSVDFVAAGERYPHVASAAKRAGVTASLSFPVVFE